LSETKISEAKNDLNLQTGYDQKMTVCWMQVLNQWRSLLQVLRSVELRSSIYETFLTTQDRK
jgi:hypothetical protein